MRVFVGIDVGSISTNVAALGPDLTVVRAFSERTEGRPLASVKRSLARLGEALGPDAEVAGACATGSAKELVRIVTGADIAKTEITAHAVAAAAFEPEVRTVLEIGGQDSKIILLENGVMTDFAMNAVCAAGTGSFLDHQAKRLGMSIEAFSEEAAGARGSTEIAGRCTVFAESDMIHKQQLGHGRAEILYGLCRAMVRNYLATVARGKAIRSPVVFQGGVAANRGIRRAFEEALGAEVRVPPHFQEMGAIGAAILAKEHREAAGGRSSFRGFDITEAAFATRSFECHDCPNRCEVVEVSEGGRAIARWGSRCGKLNL